MEEDRILRRRLAALSPEQLVCRGSDGTLSFQETLGHIAYWDAFTVEFFTAKLNDDGPPALLPEDFAQRSEEAVATAAALEFTDVLARYLEATGALVGFISRHWDRLTATQQKNFWVPLKHRRHHRIALFEALDGMAGGDQGQEMVPGA